MKHCGGFDLGGRRVTLDDVCEMTDDYIEAGLAHAYGGSHESNVHLQSTTNRNQ